MKPIAKGNPDMKSVMCLGWRGVAEIAGGARRIVFLLVALLLFGGCTSAPTASCVSDEIDRLEEPRRPADHAFSIGVFKRVLANSHPMLDLWRDMTFGRLLKNPQSWLMERERLGLAMSECREDVIEDIFAIPGFVLGDDSKVPSPPILLPYQILAIDSKASRASLAAFDMSSSPMKPLVAILPIESIANESNGSQAPSAIFERARSMMLRGDQVEVGMRFCGIVFLLFVFIIPALCSLCASHLSHPVRGSPPSARIAPVEENLTVGLLRYSS